MGWVTLLLSGVPTYVSLEDFGYYLECIFSTNSEIGMFEVRHLPEENDKPVVALDFHSGFDAIAAQEQLDGYRCQMQDGVQYILRAKITNKKKYLRSDTSPELSLSYRGPSKEKENSSAMTISSMSEGAILRANAKLNAKYRLLKKQKLIVKTQIELIREKELIRIRNGTTSLCEDCDSDDLRRYKIQEVEKKSRVRSRALRSRTRSSTSRSRSPRPRPPRSRTRTRRSSHNRHRSCSRRTESRGRSSKRITKRKERSHDRLSRSKRLRSPESSSRTRKSRSRNRCRLLAIMPKSPVKRESSILRTQPSNWKEFKNMGSNSYRTQPCNWTEYKNMESNTCRAQPSNWKEYKDIGSKDSTISVVVRKVKNTDKKILEDTSRNVDSTDKKVGFKNNPLEIKQENANRNKTRSDETMIRLICDDIMFLMKSLLLKMRENIVISDRTNELMMEKLNAVVQKRVNILYVEKNLTIYNAWEIYRKICTKEDDILLLKTMLAEITAETGNQNTLAEGANGCDSAENSNRTMSNVELDTVAHDSTVKYEHKNEDQVIEQTILETDNGNKATEAVQVVDVETYWASEKHKTLPANPQFVLVIKRLMKQLKAALKKSREEGVFVTHFHMRQVLKILLTDMLSGEEYKTTLEIIHLFRQKYPKDMDEEFIEKVAEDISMKKYNLDGVDRERQGQEDTDVILIETNPEIVTIDDSDDDSDEISKAITAVVLNNNKLTESHNTNELYLSEKKIVKEIVNSAFDPKESEKTNEINKCINDLMKCQKTNETDKNGNIELTEICDMVIQQEEEPQPGETAKDQTTGHVYAGSTSLEHINANTTINKEVQRTETEFYEINKNSREEALKVTAITIMTSESELYSIAHEVENKDETSKEILKTNKDTREEALKVTAITIMTSESELYSIAHEVENKESTHKEEIELKEEIKPELTDEDIEKILSLEDIGLNIDLHGYNTRDPCKVEFPQVGSSGLHGNCDGYNINDTCDKETPQVTSITIMTSTSELLPLLEGNRNTVKEVPEVKVNENIENEAFGDINEIVGNITNTEMMCPGSQDKQAVDDEETIESIRKYVASLFNGS